MRLHFQNGTRYKWHARSLEVLLWIRAWDGMLSIKFVASQDAHKRLVLQVFLSSNT